MNRRTRTHGIGCRPQRLLAPLAWVFAPCLLAPTAPDAAWHTNPQLGYSIQLPDAFSPTGVGHPGQEIFADPTGAAGYELSVQAFPYAADDYPEDNAWTRYHFQVYLATVGHAVYPFGAVAFLDSTPYAILDGKWSPEAYSEFFFTDTTATRAEYLRYVATPRVGYEIVAYGDSAVFAESIAFIADSLIATFRAEDTPESIRFRLRHGAEKGVPPLRDLLGRLQTPTRGTSARVVLPVPQKNLP